MATNQTTILSGLANYVSVTVTNSVFWKDSGEGRKGV